MDVIRQIIDSIRQASAPRTSSYDTPADVVRVEGSTAWVHIPGGVAETPVQLTIDAKQGDKVQVRVGGGQAWLVGNLSAPPTDDTAAKTVRAELEEAKDAIFRAIDAVSILTRRLTVQDAEGNVLANFDADRRLAELAGWQAEHGLLHTTVQDPDVPTIKRHISLNALTGEIVVEKLDATSGAVEGDIIITKDRISFGIYDGGELWYRSDLYMAADGQRGSFVFDSGAPYGGQLAVENYDHSGGTLYTGDSNISGVGDGTVTGAISSLSKAVSVTTQAGNDTTLTNNTATTVASVTLKKGTYMLTGVARFAASTAGRRTLLFSKYGNSAISFDIYALEQINPSQSGVTYSTLTWPVEITADGTTVYFNLSQNSGRDIVVDRTGIKIVALDGGGIYTVG